MSPTLPPARDLPPLRRAQIRATLVRTVAPPVARVRRWLVPASAAIAVVVIAAGSFAVSTLRDPQESSRPVATRHTPPATRHAPAVPGVTPERARQLAMQCWRSYQEYERMYDSQGWRRRPHASNRGLQLYHLVADAAGTTAVFVGDEIVLDCTIRGAPGTETFDGQGRRIETPEWLPDHLVVEGQGSVAGGLVTGEGSHVYGHEVVMGRVSAKVARVTVPFDKTEITVRPHNGVFIARLVRPVNWTFSNDTINRDPLPPSETAPRAYDSNGALVNTPGSDQGPSCFVDANGTVVLGPENPPHTCRRAVPWTGAG